MKRTLALILLTLTLFAAACGGSDNASQGAALEGTSWQFIGFADGDLFDAAPADVSASISFDGDQVRGNSGCNTFGGSFTSDGFSITFESLMSTLMGCEPTASELESRFLAVMGTVETVEVTSDGRLLLAPPQGLNLTFRSDG